jgi:dihydrolipoamide dehydrogenase
MAKHYDVIVIGAGPGGFRAASRCSSYGASVALIEKAFVGGVCLNWGCIPSKTLLTSAHTVLSAKNAENLGVKTGSVEPDWPKIQQRRQQIVEKLRSGMHQSAKNSSMDWIQGRAVITAPGKVRVEKQDGTEQLTSEKIVIATGSRPIEPGFVQFDGQTIISSKDALELSSIPQSMVIVGGGIIGCEMACAYAAFGTKVTIVELMDSLLPMQDSWVSSRLKRYFKPLDIKVLTGVKVTSVQKTNGLAKVSLEDREPLEAQKVLIAVGRAAACDQETIDNLDLQTEKSVIKVDDNFQTSAENVYALGDVIGTTYLAHGATTEADIASAAICKNKAEKLDYSLIPNVIYTFPEVASVGKTLKQCRQQGLDTSVGKGYFRANGLAVAHNDTDGEARVIVDKTSNKIAGITIVGSIATELIATATAIIGKGPETTKMTFAHPTLSEVLDDAVEDAFA